MERTIAPVHNNGLGWGDCNRLIPHYSYKTMYCPCHVARKHCISCACLKQCTNVRHPRMEAKKNKTKEGLQKPIHGRETTPGKEVE